MGILDSLRRKVTLVLGASSVEPAPLAKKITDIEKDIVDKEELEKCYIKVPVIFNTINKIVQIIMSAGYTLEGDNKSIKYFQNLLQMIGLRGGENEWDVLLTKIFQYQCIYGFAPIELIYSKDKTEIVDLDIINPKSFDYAKDYEGKIVVDTYGNPIGYVQTLPRITNVENKIQPPESVTLHSNQIFIPPERVVVFKLYTVGDGFRSVGLIEPIYKTVIEYKVIKEGFTESSHRVGFPFIVAKIGDTAHEPTEEQIKSAVEALKNMRSSNVFAHPYYNSLEVIEPRHPERLRTYLDFYIEEMVTGLGVPKAFSTGAGETTNRATLARQEYITKLTLKDIINRTTATFYSKVFSRIASVYNQNHSNKIAPIRIKWNEVALEEMDAKAERLLKYAKAGLLSDENKIKEWIKKAEGFI